MRVFVTGATGWIGQPVVKALLAAGHQVLGLARSDASAAKLKALGAQVHRGSLKELESLKTGAAECDGVIHLAFIFDFSDFEGICRADREAIAAMASVMEGSHKPLIMTSGTLMLTPGKVATEDDSHDATAFFGAARGQSEVLTQSLAAKGIRSVVMRLAPTNHGEGDGGFATMLVAAAKEKGKAVYFNPESRWPATHNLDTAQAYVLALQKAEPGSLFHITAEDAVRQIDIVTAIGKVLNVPVEQRPEEEASEFYGLVGTTITIDNPVSSKKTREVLGWVPKQNTLVQDIESGIYNQAKAREQDSK